MAISKILWKVAGTVAPAAKMALKPLAQTAKAAVMPKFKEAKLAGRAGWATSESEFIALQRGKPAQMAKPAFTGSQKAAPAEMPLSMPKSSAPSMKAANVSMPKENPNLTAPKAMIPRTGWINMPKPLPANMPKQARGAQMARWERIMPSSSAKEMAKLKQSFSTYGKAR